MPVPEHVKEVREERCTTKVNELLGSGWVLINTAVMTESIEGELWSSFVYCLAKPV